MEREQFSLFEEQRPLPVGFAYQPNILAEDEERELLSILSDLPFRAFEFHGYTGKRRVISFGWEYDFDHEKLRLAEELPTFLIPTRNKAASAFGLSASDLKHALLTEYAPGAAIGWHKDKAAFAEVVGVSLLSPCIFRFRRRVSAAWERCSFNAEPRSAYLLSGPSRTDWEHSIRPVDNLRYSITFRSLRHS
jgi:alkylated DNA repair dioxygenase AlkB